MPTFYAANTSQSKQEALRGCHSKAQARKISTFCLSLKVDHMKCLLSSALWQLRMCSYFHCNQEGLMSCINLVSGALYGSSAYINAFLMNN